MKKNLVTMWVFPIALAFMLFTSACQLPIDNNTGRSSFENTFSPDMKVESKTFSNANELKSFFASISGDSSYMLSSFQSTRMMAESAPMMDSAGSGTTKDFSGTNVQVEGVDEADILKTDGNYIYTITENTLFIIEAYPGEDARVLSRISFNNTPQGLFLNGDTIAVFGSSYTSGGRMGYWNYRGNTFVEVYDVSDRTSPQKTDSYEMEGHYTEGRMIDNHAYLIVRSYADMSLPMPTPFLRIDGVESRIQPDRIHYFGMPYRNPEYATIHILNMDNGNINSESVLVEGGETIYMSHNNLYLSTTQHISEWKIRQRTIVDVVTPRLNSDERDLIQEINNVNPRIMSSWEKDYKKLEIIEMHAMQLSSSEQDALEKEIETKVKAELEKHEFREYSIIHKISVKGNSISVGETATIPGRLNNQFAMDEYDNVLRVATTTNLLVSSFGRTSAEIMPDSDMILPPQEWVPNTENHVFTLDNNMNLLDHVRGIAPGESIFSTRFMGDRLYMVTFRQVDPFFAIDLSNPRDIQILGELKIPGFSRYLHPYDENTIIGLGRDGTDTGRILGLKISLFDVSNPQNPVEKATYTLEGQYSPSIAEWEHKAFLFSKEKEMLVIPAYSQDYRTGGERFNGALVFHITQNDISLRGLIDHARTNVWRGVERSLYIEDLLYTKSPNLLRINEISDLSSVKDVELSPLSKTDIPIY